MDECEEFAAKLRREERPEWSRNYVNFELLCGNASHAHADFRGAALLQTAQHAAARLVCRPALPTHGWVGACAPCSLCAGKQQPGSYRTPDGLAGSPVAL